ncbi:MerR family transcriptional regulator [Isobaculum melis]|uniref:DNA-binding transcriptional regulator, MerR family n=1 Tax=Isobaculum melis TaxID=142588 RepID=A0A1H9U9Y1_9LACT|nr:MerR family transcriptional regulator [Isobaculum melis]SES06142.1 DNA-binding transcriptional regulator, MerR family [Isobaculum melis]
MKDDHWTIKSIAKLTYMSVDTIRYYEKEGLLSPKRSENNYRQYTAQDFTTLKYIAVMKYAGFSLKEIKMIVQLLNSPPSTQCNQSSNQLLAKKKADLEKKVRHYQMMLQLLGQVPLAKNFEDYIENEAAMKAQGDAFIDKIFNDIGGTQYENH